MNFEDNTGAPPERPFYVERKVKKKKPSNIASPMRKEYYARKRRELEEELSKPVKERIGKLRSLKAGDFSAEEVRALVAKYGKRKR